MFHGFLKRNASDVFLEYRPWPRGYPRTKMVSSGLGLDCSGLWLGLAWNGPNLRIQEYAQIPNQDKPIISLHKASIMFHSFLKGNASDALGFLNMTFLLISVDDV